MSPEQVQQLAAAYAASTPGEWQRCTCGKCALVWSTEVDAIVVAGIGADDESYTCGAGVSEPQRRANADFCAAAHNAMPALLEALARGAS